MFAVSKSFYVYFQRIFSNTNCLVFLFLLFEINCPVSYLLSIFPTRIETVNINDNIYCSFLLLCIDIVRGILIELA